VEASPTAAAGDTRHRLFWDRNDKRQLFARDTADEDGGLVFIEVGGAERLRSQARAGRLICPVSGCPHPGFTTRAGSRRDHFAHLSNAGGHAPESVAHQQGKHLVGRWARSALADAKVHVDDERVGNNQLPDVLVVLPGGQRWAFEVQYAALTAEQWQACHDGYVAQGIHDVWLLGHLPPNLAVSRRQENRGNPHVGPLQQVIHANGLPLLWINPFTETIAAALLSGWDAAQLAATDAAGFFGSVPLGVDMLDDCTLDGDGFATPALLAHRSAMDAWRALRAAQLAEEKRRSVEVEEELRRRSEAIRGAQLRRREYAQVAAGRTDEQRADLETWKAERQRQDGEAWKRYKAETVKAALGPGPLPWYLTKELNSDRQIWSGSPNYWRCHIFLSLVDGRVGQTFRFQDASRKIAGAHTKSPTGAFNFVAEFLRRLRDIGSVDFAGDGEYFGRTADITVVADHDSLPASEPTSVWGGATIEAANPPRPRTTGPRLELNGPTPATPEQIPVSLLPTKLAAYLGTDGRRAWQELQLPYLQTLRRVPDVIADSHPNDGVLGIHPPLWRHLVVEQLLPGRVGRAVGPASASRALGFARPVPALVHTAIAEFLEVLAEAGYLAPRGTAFTVVAELESRSPASRST
jgi:hypothetical protein